tara:strand:+ start:2114 stop:2806 length:693 start_codon:yes stop_codon:yes gene_type:complete
MTIQSNKIRWANITEIDPLTGLPNKSTIPEEFKSSGAKSNQPIPRQWINTQFNEIYNAFVDLQAQLDSITGAGSQPTLEYLYPVNGQPFLSFANTDPATYLGFGTWVLIEGKVLVGVDTSDPDFNTSGKVGGAKSHSHTDNLSVNGTTLTVAQLPSASPVSLTVSTVGSASTSPANTSPLAGDNVASTTSSSNVNWGGTGATHTHSLSGGVQTSSNLMPYETLYIWRRTA